MNVLPLLLAVSLTLSAAPALACGPYGSPSPSDDARAHVWVALARAGVEERVEAIDVELSSPDRGVARVRLQRRKSPLSFRLVKRRGSWRVTPLRG